MNSAATQFFAHSLRDRPLTAWEPLLEHLNRVAERAADFAAKFGARAWGRQLGLWHDLGKYTLRFQNYLLKKNGYEAHLEEKQGVAGKVDHSTAGAKHAIREHERLRGAADGWLLAYAVAGHHAGLPDVGALRERILKPDISWEGAPSTSWPPWG